MDWDKGTKIWFNGKLVDFDDAKIHVLSHVVHYGSSVFEGVRCYAQPDGGGAVYRLKEHTRRLFMSAKIYRMEPLVSEDDFNKAILDTIRANNYSDCYIRPIFFRGFHALGVNPMQCPVDGVIATWKWGNYMGDEGVKNGVDVMVSSWTRPAPNTHPSMAKCGGNYANSQLVKMEAILNGYAEGIVLDVNGMVSEGSGENIFVVRDGKMYTPPMGTSLLEGITRGAIMSLAAEEGIPVVEAQIPREMLYVVDEVFFTGTAAEVTPVRSVDKILVGAGKPGPITLKLREKFMSIVTGKAPDKNGWLTRV